ncbi:RILP-like protein 1 isoform X1 [Hydractinia symbiolongicarpus]|uniref:RILP-like protein 1 isoform X1 n=1 Tax=Hydractinia symbiolongicarpus TaxID=13093 RepID=UPI002550322A|nr:RILP-like protein 1 isoform X1 [Hydractinia symbiolongicarpus]
MAGAEQEFTVADVYQHAAMIGQDIEVIVNDYGKEAIEEIMPKIVYVLEKLEALAERRKLDQERMDELTLEKDKLLIHTKRDEAIQRQLEEKLNYMEELVSVDKKGLESKIKHLQQENDCLCDDLDKCEKEIMKLRSHGAEFESCTLWLLDLFCGGKLFFLSEALPGDVEVMFRMKSTIDNQRDQIRQLNGELLGQKRDVEALQEQTNRLSEINEKLRRDNFVVQSKLKQFEHNNQHNAVDASAVEVLLKNTNNNFDSTDSVNNKSLAEEGVLDTTTDSEAGDIESLSSVLTEASTETVGSKSVKDPNRPRFTRKEMEDVLEQRNRFKIEKLALEEELELYKREERDRLERAKKSSTDSHRKSTGVRSFMQKFMGK